MWLELEGKCTLLNERNVTERRGEEEEREPESLLSSVSVDLNLNFPLRQTQTVSLPSLTILEPGAVLGGQQGPVPPQLWVWTPLWPPDRESALIIHWQISCNDFVLKGKAGIKCLSSLLPNQNCWNCQHCFVWMRDLSFFPGCMCPLTKKPAPTWPPY